METHEIQGDYWGLIRLIETAGDSSDSGRLMESHENPVDFWGIMRLIETAGDS